MRRFHVAIALVAISAASMPADALEPVSPVRAIVRFDSAVPAEIGQVPGLDLHYRFENAPAVVATLTPSAARIVAAAPGFRDLEIDAAVEPLLDTATIVTRARGIWEGPDAMSIGGDVVDGSGVGIAIVDTGVDGLHPDLIDRMAGNYQVTPAGLVPASNTTAPTSAHGTHVAGIAAGTGAASEGRFRGVAPGAGIYGFNVFQGISTAAIAFDWILSNGENQNPPIRVVNNSWRCTPNSCAHPLNPESNGQRLHYQLASQLAEKGVTITWAVANEKGDGDIATTTPESTNRTPGIIGVANYKDQGTTSRNMCLSSASSWGASADPTTWPDLAAPGRSIMAAWATAPSDGDGQVGGRNPVTGDKTYNDLSGTSMAAPHVAGIAALMLEANPELTPAEIEYILKLTSTPLTGSEAPSNDKDGCGIDYLHADPSHTWTPANYAAGHGLVDARAAVEMAIGFEGIPSEMPEAEEIPDSYIVARPGIRPVRTLYMTGEDGFGETYPDAAAPRIRPFGPSDVLVHTTDPLPETTFEALNVDLYLGSTAEGGDFFSIIGRTDFVTTVERLSGNEATLLHEFTARNLPVRTLGPIHRDHSVRLPAPVTLQEGDRIRLTLSAIVFPWLGVPPGVNGVWDVYSESFTPTRVILGEIVERPAPDTREACQRRKDCAMVDALHPFEGLSCASATGFRLSWTGPAGSMLVFNCDGLVTTCPVVGEPGTTGSCETDILVASTTDDHGAFCGYVLPDGGRGGSGRCMALTPIPNA